MDKDVKIQQELMELLRDIPSIRSNEIGISVLNGVVSIYGTVDSYPQKILIEKNIKKHRHVLGIVENLEVKISDEYDKTDAEISQLLVLVFEMHIDAPSDRINMIIEKGWVTLEGFVDYDNQRKKMTQLVEGIDGVKGVTNNIKIANKSLIQYIDNTLVFS
jgi:osmotically-inducible protein OsmY